MSTTVNLKTESDQILQTIAQYVTDKTIESEEAYETALLCLADSIGCALLALQFPECTKLLGPVVSGTEVPNGVRVPGVKEALDPIRAAFNWGMLIRWLDYNDTWLAAEWGHPSDNFGAILSVMDYCCRSGKRVFTVRDALTAAIKAYEIQGVLALQNSFNQVGLDHVILVKVASAAIVAGLFEGSQQQVADTLSQAWIDTGPLRTYRHAPNTGSRKSWAAGDATARGTQLAMMVMDGEMGYATALTAKKWGFYDVLFKGKEFVLERSLDSYVMENILFKISFPAEFHAQTAVEAAMKLHSEVKENFDAIEKIKIFTTEPSVRIISKSGPLHNPADRDHCLQYMIAIGLLFGELKAEHYEDDVAKDPRIDQLREKMEVVENQDFSRDYYDPEKRSIGNAIELSFSNGKEKLFESVEYPVGHRFRREEGIPLLYKKLKSNLERAFPKEKAAILLALFQDKERIMSLSVSELIDHIQGVNN